jgi:hypothetical protein
MNDIHLFFLLVNSHSIVQLSPAWYYFKRKKIAGDK